MLGQEHGKAIKGNAGSVCASEKWAPGYWEEAWQSNEHYSTQDKLMGLRWTIDSAEWKYEEI